jgi:hypothetical protein
MKKLLLLLPLLAFTGCTVVSANRVFPKLTWYWSKDAQLQHESDAAAKAAAQAAQSSFEPLPAPSSCDYGAATAAERAVVITNGPANH